MAMPSVVCNKLPAVCKAVFILQYLLKQ